MKPKTLLALVFVLLALAIGNYVLSLRESKKKEVRKEEVLIPEGIKVNYLLIRNGNKTIELVRKGDDWFLEKPIKTKADGMEVDSILFRLQSLAKVRDLGVKNFDPKIYGLENSTKTIEYRGGNGSWGKIVFGGENPAGTHIYASKNGRLFLVEKIVLDVFRRTPEEIREKRIFWGKVDDVDSYIISFKGKKVVGKKGGDRWTLKGNLCKTYDPMKADYIVDDFGFLRFKEIKGNLSFKGTPILVVVFKNKKGEKIMDFKLYKKDKISGLFPACESINGLTGYLDQSRFNILKDDIEKLCKMEVKNGPKKDKGQKGGGKESR